jgi:hypothetical protein
MLPHPSAMLLEELADVVSFCSNFIASNSMLLEELAVFEEWSVSVCGLFLKPFNP